MPASDHDNVELGVGAFHSVWPISREALQYAS